MLPIRRMGMDFRALRYFLCVAEARSFSKAAELLHIAQPALSRQVRKLEEELGAELFLRSKSGVELTDSGLMLVPKAASLLRQLSQVADDIRAQSSSIRGTITFGVPPATGELLMTPVVERCIQEYPNIQLNIVEGFSGYIFERLINGELTFVLLHSPVQHRSITVEPILIEPMYLVGPGRELNGLQPVVPGLRPEHLPLILPGPTRVLRLQLEKAFAQMGWGFEIKHEVEGLVMIKSMVAAGLGYTVCTYGAVYQQVSEGKLSAARLEYAELNSTLCLAYRTEQQEMRSLTAVRNLIRSEIHRLVDDGKWRGAPQYALAEAQFMT